MHSDEAINYIERLAAYRILRKLTWRGPYARTVINMPYKSGNHQAGCEKTMRKWLSHSESRGWIRIRLCIALL